MPKYWSCHNNYSQWRKACEVHHFTLFSETNKFNFWLRSSTSKKDVMFFPPSLEVMGSNPAREDQYLVRNRGAERRGNVKASETRLVRWQRKVQMNTANKRYISILLMFLKIFCLVGWKSTTVNKYQQLRTDFSNSSFRKHISGLSTVGKASEEEKKNSNKKRKITSWYKYYKHGVSVCCRNKSILLIHAPTLYSRDVKHTARGPKPAHYMVQSGRWDEFAVWKLLSVLIHCDV